MIFNLKIECIFQNDCILRFSIEIEKPEKKKTEIEKKEL